MSTEPHADQKSLADVKIARVSTVAFFIETQLHQQMNTIVDAGMDLTLIASEVQLGKPIPHSRYHAINIPRKIELIQDLFALYRLWRFFRKEKFTIVHSTTPKAGLLCAIAAKLAGAPVRLHTFTGQPWVTLSGVKRKLAIWSDKLIVKLNTQCYTDSPSQTQFMEQQGIAPLNKLQTLNQGSLAGVDFTRFNPDLFNSDTRKQLKCELGIPEDAVTLLFVGRISKDKGIIELVHAFKQLLQNFPEAYLLLAGPLELENTLLNQLDLHENKPNQSHIILTGYTPKPEAYMAISDLLCLPSYREGFGTVIIEAAAMGLPAVATNIYGLTDAVVHNETGLLVEAKQVDSLQQALQQLIEQPEVRRTMGLNAQRRAQKLFDEKIINQLLLDEYRNQLNVHS
ncbi:MAG: glycosyltransferase family 4 protein [Pseudomonadota bacterium]|nr:glycosyltransferase family 4 protein [Pseudomonadota bacterium]